MAGTPPKLLRAVGGVGPRSTGRKDSLQARRRCCPLLVQGRCYCHLSTYLIVTDFPRPSGPIR